LQLSSWHLAEVMATTDFFQEFLTIGIQERSYGELQYAQNDTNYCFLPYI
jgi:hypothetical protein